ncbi:MAG: A/G-specific adenine glycosylase [Victivallaceae bacterium]
MSSISVSKFPIVNLNNWFNENKRFFPWRINKTPYRVWISEVMLQQTVAKTVVPYFEKWMYFFPNIGDVASASEESILKLWEGLGYYSRARNIKAGAIEIVRKFGGQWPEDLKSLLSIKGIGPYTASAVLSFAFGKKTAPVDGNVLRVLARYFSIEEKIDSFKGRRLITSLAERLLPDDEPSIVAEGLIELGALVCNKRPSCKTCPLQSGCNAFKYSLQSEYPKRLPKKGVSRLFRLVGVFISSEGVLLNFRYKGLMAGLYEFPYFDVEEQVFLTENTNMPFRNILSQVNLQEREELSVSEHFFTRYKVKLRPTLFRVDFLNDFENFVPWTRVKSLPLSSGHASVLRLVQSKFDF